MKTIISLFDYSGTWVEPYRNHGYDIIQVDIKNGIDILTWNYKWLKSWNVYGILSANPCTDYALSGARWFSQKDITYSNCLVDKTREIIEYFNPHFWVVENPMSRIHKIHTWLGDIKFKFNPCDFAGYGFPEERYNKQTWLWGKFNQPIKKRLEPLQKEFPGYTNLGGKSERTKELRSITPKGFSYAFYLANQ